MPTLATLQARVVQRESLLLHIASLLANDARIVAAWLRGSTDGRPVLHLARMPFPPI